MEEQGQVVSLFSTWSSTVILRGKKEQNVYNCAGYRKVNDVSKLDGSLLLKYKYLLHRFLTADYLTTVVPLKI